jgi:hypothetical protein
MGATARRPRDVHEESADAFAWRAGRELLATGETAHVDRRNFAWLLWKGLPCPVRCLSRYSSSRTDEGSDERGAHGRLAFFGSHHQMVVPERSAPRPRRAASTARSWTWKQDGGG